MDVMRGREGMFLFWCFNNSSNIFHTSFLLSRNFHLDLHQTAWCTSTIFVG